MSIFYGELHIAKTIVVSMSNNNFIISHWCELSSWGMVMGMVMGMVGWSWSWES